MKRNLGVLVLIVGLLLIRGTANAAIVNVDLYSAVTGTFIDGVGADFASTFVGQSVVGGTGISGSPSGPLTLAPVNTIDTIVFSGSNSMLPEPGNQGPLSMLLDSAADSISWMMGYGEGGSVTIDFFGLDGSLVYSTVENNLSGYNVYTYSGFGVFYGLTIYNNTDDLGLRYQNFSYNTAAPVPIPAAAWLLGSGLVGLAGLRRKFRRQCSNKF